MNPLKLYHEVVQCPLHCNGITNDRSLGFIPRSFYWGKNGRDVQLLIVSKNPGTAPAWEVQRYLQADPERWAQVHYDLCHDVFGGALSVGSGYHVNLVKRAAAILGCEATAEAVFSQAAMTALAKYQSAGAKTDKVPDATFTACSERYFFREVALFKPVYLLALGTEVFNFLTRPDVVARHGLPVGKLWHPSWTNMPGGEAAYFRDELPRLRAQYLEALDAPNRKPNH
jgi:uracil-DNA glycosylase